MGFLAEHANYAYTIGLVGVFVGVCLAMSSLHYLVIKPISRQKRLERRLRKTEKDRLTKIQILKTINEDEKSLFLTLAESLAGLSKIENFQRFLLQGDVFWKPTTFISVMGFLFCTGFVAGMFLKSNALGLMIGLGLAFLPVLVVRFRTKANGRKFQAAVSV